MTEGQAEADRMWPDLPAVKRELARQHLLNANLSMLVNSHVAVAKHLCHAFLASVGALASSGRFKEIIAASAIMVFVCNMILWVTYVIDINALNTARSVLCGRAEVCHDGSMAEQEEIFRKAGRVLRKTVPWQARLKVAATVFFAVAFVSAAISSAEHILGFLF